MKEYRDPDDPNDLQRFAPVIAMAVVASLAIAGFIVAQTLFVHDDVFETDDATEITLDDPMFDQLSYSPEFYY